MTGRPSESPGPTAEQLVAAELLLGHLADEVGGAFRQPNVPVAFDGDLVLEWWWDDRKLTVYLDQRVGYVRSWDRRGGFGFRVQAHGASSINDVVLAYRWMRDG